MTTHSGLISLAVLDLGGDYFIIQRFGGFSVNAIMNSKCTVQTPKSQMKHMRKYGHWTVEKRKLSVPARLTRQRSHSFSGTSHDAALSDNDDTGKLNAARTQYHSYRIHIVLLVTPIDADD